MNPTFKRGVTAMLLACAVFAGVAAATLTRVFHSKAEPSAPQAVLSANPYVILIRHGDAPGRNEPPAFDLHDCDTQRNLSDQGRNEARDLGQAIKARDINVTKILASRWCRTQETAQLLDLAPVESSSAFDNLEMNRFRATALIDRERELIASWRGPGVMLVVTHSSNIKLLTGMNIEQGSMIVAPPMDDTSSTPRFGKIVLKSNAS